MKIIIIIIINYATTIKQTVNSLQSTCNSLIVQYLKDMTYCILIQCLKNVLTKSICIPNIPKLKFICSIKDEYSNVNDVYQNSKLITLEINR